MTPKQIDLLALKRGDLSCIKDDCRTALDRGHLEHWDVAIKLYLVQIDRFLREIDDALAEAGHRRGE